MSNAKSPILLIIFNRPAQTKLVLGSIKQYQPPTLYVAADGPRPGSVSDEQNCAAARLLINEIDWPCEVKKLFRDTNLGCKKAVSGAITWFFEQEEEGIILEDDCLPGESFYTFCNSLLEKYRNDHRVMHIAGSNLQFGKQRGDGSYYFSCLSSIWGWASWRRVWQNYDVAMKGFQEFDEGKWIYNIIPDKNTADWIMGVTRLIYQNQIDTWDYQLGFSILINNGLCITPNKNLVSNIGFGENASLTKNANDIHANIPVETIDEIIHPDFFIPDREADQYQLSLSMPKTTSAPVKASIPVRIFGKVKRSAKKIFNV